MTQQPLTDQQLDDIEQRASAATPGPWCTDSWEIYQGREDDVPDLMKWIGETCRAEDSDGSRNDAAFIAHARTDVPALLAEIRRQRTEAHLVAIEQVQQIFAAELSDERALILLDALIVLRSKLPCTCARSQGLHDRQCRRYVPGHELLSPARRLARAREELCRAAAAASGGGR